MKKPRHCTVKDCTVCDLFRTYGRDYYVHVHGIAVARSAVEDEYHRLRRKDWHASEAWRAAKVNTTWHYAERAGLVRVRCEPEECIPVEYFAPEFESRDEENRWHAHVNNVGIWWYVTEYLDPVDGWTYADSCGGFIGDDWEDSGYDVDMKEAALAALDSVDVAMCAGWC